MIFILRIFGEFVRSTRIPRHAVVDVRDDGHRADVPRLRLDLLQLGEGEVDLRGGGSPVREGSASPRSAGGGTATVARWSKVIGCAVLCCSRGSHDCRRIRMHGQVPISSQLVDAQVPGTRVS